MVMSEPPNADGGPSSESSAASPSTPASAVASQSRANLDAYLAANAGRYTDDALYGTLVAAGYPADDVRAALANAAANPRPQRTVPRAARTILVAYVAVFALLSAGMLLNNRPGGYPLMPNAAGGIWILAWSLGAALVASLIWVASRRLFVIIILGFIGLYGIGAFASGGGNFLIGLIIAIFGIGSAVLVLRSPGSAGPVREPELAFLLAIPVLLLLGIGGICLASGLPIPGGT
jgi:hypothetical protein